MKVKIGPYKDWFGPYQLAQKILFWVPKEKDEHGFPRDADIVDKFGDWLAHGSIEKEEAEVGDIIKFGGSERPVTWLYKLLIWIDKKRKRKVEVHIDRWDTWNMEYTLGLIALPMLKQLKETKHGSPSVDDEDVPEELRSTSAPPKENEWDTDENWHKRWAWVLDEMIFAFETKCGDLQDWESQFYTGKSDTYLQKLEDGNWQMIRGENDTSKFDNEGFIEYQKRISNGFRLFGKYYEGLWD